MSEAINIAVSGLRDSVSRIANAALNLVNASSTGRLPKNSGDKTEVFIAKDVVTLSDSVAGNNLGVRSALRERDPAYVLATDKNSPYANEEGLIAAPNVDMGSELLAMKMAEIAYRANAAVIKTQENNDKRLFDALR